MNFCTDRQSNQVLVMDIPQELIDCCPTADEVMMYPGWSPHENISSGQSQHVYRTGIGWKDRSVFPKEFVGWVDAIGCNQISLFGSMGAEGASYGLPWHHDQYWVYSWNLEGETTWEYFDMPTGEIKTLHLGEMDQMVMMPIGTPHRVLLRSEDRTSISIVRNGSKDNMDHDYRQQDTE